MRYRRRVTPTPTIRHGYYLAASDQQHGDPELAQAAVVVWRRVTEGMTGRWGLYDGVSVFEAPGGRLLHRICLDNFFNDSAFKVEVFDVPP